MFKMLKTVFALSISVGGVLVLTFIASDYISFSAQGGPDHWDSFFSVFGMLYAIISGFLLVDVLGRYNDLSNTFEGELNAVEDVRDFLIYVDGEQDAVKLEVKKRLSAYIRSISRKEWPAMIKGKALNSDTSEELYNVMKAVDKIEVTNESDRVALGSLIDRISDLTTLRTKRISLANQKLPSRLKLLTFFMSVILVLGMILVGAKELSLHMGMVGSVTFAVHLLYMIIVDLDKPFNGTWRIDKTPLDAVEKAFESEFGHF